jgi:hypothetical protein
MSKYLLIYFLVNVIIFVLSFIISNKYLNRLVEILVIPYLIVTVGVMFIIDKILSRIKV